MAEKVEKSSEKLLLLKKIMEQILMFNNLFERYFDWAKIQFKKDFIF